MSGATVTTARTWVGDDTHRLLIGDGSQPEPTKPTAALLKSLIRDWSLKMERGERESYKGYDILWFTRREWQMVGERGIAVQVKYVEAAEAVYGPLTWYGVPVHSSRSRQAGWRTVFLVGQAPDTQIVAVMAPTSAGRTRVWWIP